jgi:hypothetical protein
MEHVHPDRMFFLKQWGFIVLIDKLPPGFPPSTSGTIPDGLQ